MRDAVAGPGSVSVRTSASTVSPGVGCHWSLSRWVSLGWSGYLFDGGQRDSVRQGYLLPDSVPGPAWHSALLLGSFGTGLGLVHTNLRKVGRPGGLAAVHQFAPGAGSRGARHNGYGAHCLFTRRHLCLHPLAGKTDPASDPLSWACKRRRGVIEVYRIPFSTCLRCGIAHRLLVCVIDSP